MQHLAGKYRNHNMFQTPQKTLINWKAISEIKHNNFYDPSHQKSRQTPSRFISDIKISPGRRKSV